MQANYYHIVKLLCLMLLGISAPKLSAQSLSIQGELDKSEMKTGEQAAVNLTIRTENLPQTNFRLSNDGKERSFEVLELAALDTIELDNKLLEIKARLLITSFDSTLVRIPPIVVETPTAIDSTQSFALNVIQPKVDISKPNDFKEIKSPWEVSLTWRDILDIILSSPIFWAIVVLLLLSLIAFFAYRWYNKRKEEMPISQAKVSVPTLIEEFEQSVKLIEERNYIAQVNFKTYYTLLIEALKNYLDAKLNLMTMEQTSNEVLETLKGLAYSPKELNSLEEVFCQSDLSKFAKSKPSEDEAQTSMQVVRHFAYLVEQEEEAKKAESLQDEQNP